jgi:hypothetical protein
LFAARRIRGIQFPIAPGEWLWTGLGLSDILCMTVVAGIFLGAGNGQPTWTAFTVASWHGVRYLIATLPYLLSALFAESAAREILLLDRNVNCVTKGSRADLLLCRDERSLQH